MGIPLIAEADTVMDHEAGGLLIEFGEFAPVPECFQPRFKDLFHEVVTNGPGGEAPWKGYDSECLIRYGDATYLVSVLSDRDQISVDELVKFPATPKKKTRFQFLWSADDFSEGSSWYGSPELAEIIVSIQRGRQIEPDK